MSDPQRHPGPSYYDHSAPAAAATETGRFTPGRGPQLNWDNMPSSRIAENRGGFNLAAGTATNAGLAGYDRLPTPTTTPGARGTHGIVTARPRSHNGGGGNYASSTDTPATNDTAPPAVIDHHAAADSSHPMTYPPMMPQHQLQPYHHNGGGSSSSSAYGMPGQDLTMAALEAHNRGYLHRYNPNMQHWADHAGMGTRLLEPPAWGGSVEGASVGYSIATRRTGRDARELGDDGDWALVQQPTDAALDFAHAGSWWHNLPVDEVVQAGYDITLAEMRVQQQQQQQQQRRR
ncbi:hypothetical protein C8A05DRAFT_29438 [Staphylotrichum tortipilum]|uniref:Uncharacterized protein n=1 Tax=Staphylotrichum tortipilum TaxID=2831512 RepID=A0AAN6MUF6_9PEZI|nr:hypothetical protein C8A05DRAFT_29438 [Staphylotrichum longicolle]